MAFGRGVFRRGRRLSLLVVVVLMLGFNIAAVTVAAVGSAVSSLLGLFDVATTLDVPGNRTPSAIQADDLHRQNARLADDLVAANRRTDEALAQADDLRRRNTRMAGELGDLRIRQTALRDQADSVLRRVRTRTVEVAAANAGSTVGESIPFDGVAIIVAATSYELWSSCGSMKDLHQLSLDPGLAEDDADVTTVCGLTVPTVAEIWQAIRSSPGAVWRAATEALASIDLPDIALASLEMPDLGGWWEWAVSGWWSGEEAVAE